MKKIIILLICSMLLILSCNLEVTDGSDSIIGTWVWAETANNGNIYRFNTDGSYTLHKGTDAEVLIEEGTYSFINNTLTYNIISFDDSGTYRDVVLGDYSKIEISNCLLRDNIFSHRALEGTSSSFIGTWNSFGFVKYYKLGSNGNYLSFNYADFTKVFTSTTYTCTYNEVYEYDENGVVLADSLPDFIYTDVTYVDSENWTGLDTGGSTWKIRSKLITDINKSYLLFEYMNRVE